jgi:transposase InsO family protein
MTTYSSIVLSSFRIGEISVDENRIGLHKTELIEAGRPWRTSDEVELATLEWIDWFNNRRLHGA